MHRHRRALEALGPGAKAVVAPGRPAGRSAGISGRAEARAEALVARCDPLQRGLGQLIKETALEVVARLAVQHPGLRVAQVQAFARTGDGHVHQAALFLQPLVVVHRVLVREQALFQAGDENAIKFQSLGRVHRHQLHRILTGLGLVVAGLQRCVRQEGGQGREGFAVR